MSLPIKKMYQRCEKLPFGKRIFSYCVGRMARYTGSMGAQVQELRDGYARITLRDRPKVRNHLKSVHAIAMMNLGELTTGLAFLYGVSEGTRGIPTNLSIEYVKKARGLLTSECNCEIPKSNETQNCDLVAVIKDQAGDVVARAKATWRIGPEG